MVTLSALRSTVPASFRWPTRPGFACPPTGTRKVAVFLLMLMLFAWPALHAAAVKADLPDPEMFIPFTSAPPVIDGRIDPAEWRGAAGVGMLEAYPCYVARVVRKEQAQFRVCWDAENLYVAMDSPESNTLNAVVAACSMHDNLRIAGDDEIELMVAPGAGEKLQQYDFPTYYMVVNPLGTIWDAKFIPLLAESHNSWESGIQMAHHTDGAHWSCELRIPFRSFGRDLPQAGQTWRMNFVRTYYNYNYAAWSASGGFNNARVGGNVTFSRDTAAVRLPDIGPLATGKLGLQLEVTNPTPSPQTVTLSLTCTGKQQAKDTESQPVGSDSTTVTVPPGDVRTVTLGKGEALLPLNRVGLTATDAAGHRLYALERDVTVPLLVMEKQKAPDIPLVYVFPRFLPSRERLAVLVDATAWARKTGAAAGAALSADIRVFAKGKEDAAPVLSGILTEFHDFQGTWRETTQALPEGEYTVKVRVADAAEKELVAWDDWFEKRIFPWMRQPAGIGDAVPTPYTPVAAKDRTLQCWGREYRLTPAGLPAGVASQGRELLTGESSLLAEVDDKPVAWQLAEPVSFPRTVPAQTEAHATVTGANLKVELGATFEYDGFLRYRLTYGPQAGTVNLNRLRLRVPLAAKHATFYSAAGDTQGTTVLADLLPQQPGKVYDSLERTRSVCCSPTFATLFWTADHDVCFCYAADSDRGWVLRDDAPAVEAWREGDTVVLWLNLVDKPVSLSAPRTLEFAFQAGPTKPLPADWRAVQDQVHPTTAPRALLQVGGSGNTMPGGGTNFIHPGATPEEQKRSREYLEGQLAKSGAASVIGYTYWATVPKGFAETRVFRGEWGIDRQTWERADKPIDWAWKQKFYGPDPDRYILMHVKAVPSYVDFLTYAYDLALTHTPISGTYDDCGYPNPVYDEELDLGSVRDDGRKVWSSGLWIYRERWKRAAYVNFLHNRPNQLADSQHVHAHFLPAYHFIGLWKPCEHGFYNPFEDRDNLGFYGSLERYAAFNPSRQFGQIPIIGMSSPQKDPGLRARDTRCMMLLAMLNDQDLGSWNAGGRDSQTIGALRQARNQFRPWENEVTFAGYWENGAFIQARPAETVRVSLYRRPDRCLLIVGNVGDAAANAEIAPVWKKLPLDPAALQLTDAENGQPIAWDHRILKLTVPRHDLRVLLLAP